MPLIGVLLHDGIALLPRRYHRPIDAALCFRCNRNMTTIIGLCGSLRHRSLNCRLLRSAAEMAPPGTALESESIREIPLYNGDVEVERGVPVAVQRLKDRIAEADGLLIVTPEYNHSVPGVLKNAIDWLSRPAADVHRVFHGLPVAIMGATPGPGGTALAQAAWLPVVRQLGMRPWFEGAVLISHADAVFDHDGRVMDPATRQRISAFVEGFAAFVSEQQRRHSRRAPAAAPAVSERTA
jgi:chromate reductase